MNPLRVAVIGAGHLGRIHTRLLRGRADIEFLGIVEPSAETRQRVATEFQTTGYATVEEIWDRLDAAVVVTPTKYHHAVTLPLLEHGVHCLVEKPITFSLDDADELIAAARRHDRVLQVGHVERFNPALTTIRPHLGPARYIEATRTSGYTFRSIDIGVVLDLMIHDIDIVLALAQSAVVDVRAIGTPVLGPHEDMAQARLEFASGCVANLTASRTSFQQQRTLQIYSPTAFAALDLGTRQAKLVRVGDKIARGQVDVQRSGPAIQTNTVPVEQAIRHVAGLLNFCEDNASAGRMNRPGRQRNAIADFGDEGMQAFRHGSGVQASDQFVARDTRSQSRINPSCRFGLHDHPRFRLAGNLSQGPGKHVVGVNLD